MKTWIALTAAALVSSVCFAEKEAPAALSFEPLPYAYDALEPHIDAMTMEIHYSRHHRGYFDKLVKALEDSPMAGKTLEQIFANASKASVGVRNNAGGHYNHTLFWKCMSPEGGGAPTGELAEQIDTVFGSLASLKAEFSQAGIACFGSGWVWLCVAEDGTLFVSSTPNQDNPLMDLVERRGTPILALDVWEHAYYLKYQNQRSNYIDTFWNVVNWPEVAARFEAARQ